MNQFSWARAWGFAALAGSVLGTALQLRQAALWEGWCYGAMGMASLGMLATLFFTHRPRGAGAALAVALLAGAAGGAGLAGWRAVAIAREALLPALEGRDLEIVGVIAQMPQRIEGGLRLRVAVESAREAGSPGQPVRVPASLRLGWYAGAGAVPPVAHAGQRWHFVVRLRAPHGTLNPHGFDQELWLWEQGIGAVGSVVSGSVARHLEDSWRHPVERAREAVRDAVYQRLPDARRAGVVAALITGDQAAIERADWEVFRTTGVAHLMSISGLHVTLFAWLARWGIGALWRRSGALMLRWPAQQAGLAGGGVLAALYALFSGWGVPSQRTVYMLASVALLRLAGLRWPWPFVWLGACAVVVALDPWALMQAGFWLSFVAVGVLFATDSGSDISEGRGAWARVLRMGREQWVITLALTPLSVLLFQQVSLVGFVANAVAIPWVTLGVTPLSLLGVLWPPVWDAAGVAVALLGRWLQWLAAWPGASVSLSAPPLWAAVCGVAGGVVLVLRWPWHWRVLGLPMLLPVLLWQVPRPAPGQFDLLAADVGQGNAVLVRTAHHSLLYDAGPRYGPDSDAGARVLVPLLRAWGERLDVLVLSHRDTDHTGGAAAVLAMQPQARLLASIERAHPLWSLRSGQHCVAGQRWDWDGVHFEVLHPMAQDEQPGVAPNALSCVLRIGNGQASALLVGDIERAQEAALTQREAALDADVLLVPHHGSKTSSSEVLLDAVHPHIAWVQAGYRNRFGHPAAIVLARYAARGVAVVDTPHCGAASWRSDEPGQWRCEREMARRYWHHRLP